MPIDSNQFCLWKQLEQIFLFLPIRCQPLWRHPLVSYMLWLLMLFLLVKLFLLRVLAVKYHILSSNSNLSPGLFQLQVVAVFVTILPVLHMISLLSCWKQPSFQKPAWSSKPFFLYSSLENPTKLECFRHPCAYKVWMSWQCSYSLHNLVSSISRCWDVKPYSINQSLFLEYLQ